jgi:hypothetical protein
MEFSGRGVEEAGTGLRRAPELIYSDRRIYNATRKPQSLARLASQPSSEPLPVIMRFADLCLSFFCYIAVDFQS